MLALRSVARRVLQLQAEERELGRQIEALTRKLAPQLLDQPGVGPHAAAQLVLSWSHHGRIRSEAAFARLAGAAPIPASSGQTVRHRLDRSGDRKLNRALHMILITRKRAHPPTIAYIERRMHEGKTRREADRCLSMKVGRGSRGGFGSGASGWVCGFVAHLSIAASSGLIRRDGSSLRWRISIEDPRWGQRHHAAPAGANGSSLVSIHQLASASLRATTIAATLLPRCLPSRFLVDW